MLRNALLASLVLLAACLTITPCDMRHVAETRAGEGAIDCGAAQPYAGRYSEASREFSVGCMADALEAHQPFFGAWLFDCELDTCHYEGRAYDGNHLFVLQQAILRSLPETSTVTIQTCTPELRERTVTTAGGDVIRREVACGDVTEVDELHLQECRGT